MRDGQTVKDDSPAQLKSTLGDRIIRITCQHESEIATISQWLDSNSIEHITCNRLILGHHADSSLAASCPVDSASITIAPPTLDDVYTYYAQAPVLTESTGARS